LLSARVQREVRLVLPDQSDNGPQSPSPASLRADLQRAHAAIQEAELAANPSERFLAAHLAALRVAAIILRVWAAPSRQPGRPRNAWRLVAEVAPEFAEWADLFAATEAKRDAIRSGARTVVSDQEADALVRDARTFLRLVERSVGE
jgi:HEPN superfamily protein